MKNLLLVLILTISINLATAQEGISFIEDKTWEEVLTIAQKEDKVIFLDAYTTWCGPCKKMTKEVFPLASVGSHYNAAFINVKMNMEKGDGARVAERYNIRAFPTLMFISANGEVLHRVAGFQSEERMLQMATDAFNPATQLAAMKRKYEKGNREPQFLYDFAYASQKALEDRNYYIIASEYLETQEDWSTKKNMKFVLDFVSRTDMKMFDYLLENRTVFNKEFGSRTVTAKVERLVSTRIDQLLSLKDGEEEKIFEEAHQIFSKIHGEKATGMTASFKMTYYRNGGDRQNFAKAAVEYVQHMPDLSAGELSDIAWTFYQVIEDEDQLKMALKWAKKALKMEKDVAHYDTVASLYHKLGNNGKAKKFAKKGIKYAKATDAPYDNLTDLLENI